MTKLTKKGGKSTKTLTKRKEIAKLKPRYNESGLQKKKKKDLPDSFYSFIVTLGLKERICNMSSQIAKKGEKGFTWLFLFFDSHTRPNRTYLPYVQPNGTFFCKKKKKRIYLALFML